jgi:hypothetical protein
MRALALTAALAWVSVAGCSAVGENSQVLVIIQAEPGVRARASSLRLDVSSGPAGSQLTELAPREQRTATPLMAGDWPRSIVLVPTDRDANRVYQLEATALDDADRPVASVRVFSGYVARTTRVLTLWLRDSCLDVMCDPASTCDHGSCVMVVFTDPGTLPLRDVDAGGEADGGMDARAANDTGSSTDVGPPDVPDAWLPDAHRCTAAECDDSNACTDDLCNATTGLCEHSDNAAACDDTLFCNGLDTCGGGTCSAHAGNPCSGGTTCDEPTDSCLGCTGTGMGNCPAPMMGSFGSCGGFGDACDVSGTQTRMIRSFTCVSGSCVSNDVPDTQPCSRTTDGNSCGTSSCGAYGVCTGAPLGCAGGMGTQSASCTDHACASGICGSVTRTDTQACFTRPPDGTTCDDGSACTGPDSCMGGSCVGTPTCISDAGSVCDDAIPCTRDMFMGTCRHTNDDSLCPPIGCSIGTCSPMSGSADANGCVYTACFDGGSLAPCSTNGLLCDDGIICTIDQCMPGASGADANGCIHSPGTCPDGSLG